MTPEQILAIKPKLLTQKQREDYFNDGFICVQKAIGDEWITKLRAATDEMVARSRKVTKSDKVFDLEPRHTPEAPRLRRVSNPNEQHPAYWDYCLKSPMADIVSDLVGPDVKFHHSKLNFKWANGGEEVKWHYDISFYPHTNYSPLTVGTYLYDCGTEQGPLACLPRSHTIDPMPTQYNAEGHWTGCLNDDDVKKLVDMSKARFLPGPAGSITIHNCRTLHYSAPNDSDIGRPLLLNAMSSADAFPYTVNPIRPVHDGYILRGQRARIAHHDPRPCLMPPDWSKGYTSIFTQQNEGEKELIAR
jgi:ectoine hydroxylase-related dioxygenase (phytanoyl-CoA dioxygenase family)